MSWSLIAVKDFCKTSSGGTPSRSVPEYYDGTIPWIKSGDLREKTVEQATEFITELAVRKSSAKIVPSGAILLAMYGATVGRMAMLGIDAATNQAVCSIVPDERQAYTRYVYYALLAKVPEFLRNAVGGAQPNISQGMIKDTKLLFPPLTEQKRIASILDKADAIRRKRQQVIKLADEFLRSLFLDMFGDPVTNPKGWSVKPLSSGIESITSGWSANGESYPCENDEFGVLKISSVTSGRFIPEENKFVHQDDIPEGKRLVFPKKGDLLFSRANTRELVAATCVVQQDQFNVFLPDKIWKIQTDNDTLLPEFLNYLISEPRFKEKLTSQATGTSGSMLNISKAKFEATNAIFPDYLLQSKFRAIFWKTQGMIENLNCSLEGSERAFSSLSQRAFSGQL